MTTIVLAIVAAALALGVGRGLNLPVGVPAILAGAGLSMLPLGVDVDLVYNALLLAATFLIFSVGTEIDRENVAQYQPAALAVTGIYLLATIAIAAVLWGILRLDVLTLTYLALALASSSTLVAVELFRRREQFFEPVGRVVRATSLTQDAAVIVILSIIVVVTGETASTLRAAVATPLLAAAAWVTKRWVAPKLLIEVDLSEEERLLFVLALVFLFVGLCWWGRLPFVLGVFLAGTALSSFPVGATVRGYVASFSDFFNGLFFVFLGVVVSAPDPDLLTAEIVLIGAVFLLRPILLMPVMRRVGLTTRSSVEAVIGLANCGELALLVMLIGRDLGHVQDEVLSVVTAVVVITMASAPFLSSDRVVRRLTRWYPSRRRGRHPSSPKDHIVLIGCGEAGQIVLDTLEERDAQVVVIDEDPTVIERLADRDVWSVRGDGSDPDILEKAAAGQATVVVSTMRRMEDNLRLVEHLPQQRVLVRVFSEADGQRIRALGGVAVVEAALGADAFFSWYDRQAFEGDTMAAEQS